VPAFPWRPVLLLLGGNLIGAVVGGIFFITASRLFTLQEMGRYVVAISLHWIAFGLLGTGLSIATLRVARDRLLAGDTPGAAGVVALAATTGMLGGIVIACVAFAFLSWVAIPLGVSPRVAFLAITWAGARALLDCVRAGLLAQQRFMRAAILSGFTAFSGLFVLVLALSTGALTVVRLLETHTAGILIGAFASIALLGPLVREGVRHSGSRELFAYARWPALSEGTRLLQVNLGAPLLALVAGAGQAGIFGLGRYPAYLFDIVAVSLYQYWLSQAVQVTTAARMREYLVPQFKVAGLLGLATLVGALLALPVLPLLGDAFVSVRLLFFLCAVDFAIVLLVRPIESAYHGLGRPRLELVQRGVTLQVLAVSALVLARRWGALGMVGAHIIASVVSLACGAFLIHRALAGTAREAA
jgi:O-antigen/teichoic acid export membrane protein